MKKELKQRIKDDSPIIFIATYAAIVANYGFNNKLSLNIFELIFWKDILFPLAILTAVAIIIGYFILWLAYKLFD